MSLAQATQEKQSVPDGERPVVHIAIVYGFWQGASYSGARPVFLLCFIIFHAQHPIPHANMGLDQMRRVRASFQFFAQRCHINSQGSNIIFLCTAPYLLCDGCVRQNFAHITSQYTQQLILNRSQVQLIFTQPCTACRKINFQKAIDKNRTVRSARSQ